jgi:hypothetical protein
MDLYRIISELVQERNRLEKIIQSLEGMMPGKAQIRPPGKRRGRKSMDRDARQEVSERMKLYWAKRRKEPAEPKHGGKKQDPKGHQ